MKFAKRWDKAEKGKPIVKIIDEVRRYVVLVEAVSIQVKYRQPA